MLNEKCRNRLDNWKFRQAVDHLDDNALANERSAVHALAETFGNCGWFEGSMGLIVHAAVEWLLGLDTEAGSAEDVQRFCQYLEGLD